MLKINVAYIDRNDVEQYEELWFHLSDEEIDRFVGKYDPTYADFEEHVVGARKDLKPPPRWRILSDLISTSYVEKHPHDENCFFKNLRSSFYLSKAREALLVSLLGEYHTREYFVVGLLGRENSQILQLL